jgi:hypothetical protein
MHLLRVYKPKPFTLRLLTICYNISFPDLQMTSYIYWKILLKNPKTYKPWTQRRTDYRLTFLKIHNDKSTPAHKKLLDRLTSVTYNGLTCAIHYHIQIHIHGKKNSRIRKNIDYAKTSKNGKRYLFLPPKSVRMVKMRGGTSIHRQMPPGS